MGMQSRVDLLEQRRAAEIQEQMQERRVLASRRHIEENIMTLKCPRCHQAFLDFDGCFALRCSRCPCGFCAWCGADSGSNDAHAHVQFCQEKPVGAEGFFGTQQQFEEAQRLRRQRLLDEYLLPMRPALKSAIAREMRQDLADLGLVVRSS